MRKIGLLFGLLAVMQFTTAQAYIGPGAGAGTIAIVLGVLSSIVLGFLGILWYPIKRLLRGKKPKATAKTAGGSVGGQAELGASGGSDTK